MCFTELHFAVVFYAIVFSYFGEEKKSFFYFTLILKVFMLYLFAHNIDEFRADV